MTTTGTKNQLYTIGSSNCGVIVKKKLSCREYVQQFYLLFFHFSGEVVFYIVHMRENCRDPRVLQGGALQFHYESIRVSHTHHILME